DLCAVLPRSHLCAFCGEERTEVGERFVQLRPEGHGQRGRRRQDGLRGVGLLERHDHQAGSSQEGHLQQRSTQTAQGHQHHRLRGGAVSVLLVQDQGLQGEVHLLRTQVIPAGLKAPVTVWWPGPLPFYGPCSRCLPPPRHRVGTARKNRRKAMTGTPWTKSANAKVTDDDVAAIDRWWRTANYLSVGQIYLLDNPLLREPLTRDHVKPRLVGHWGTTSGLNFLYAHLN